MEKCTIRFGGVWTKKVSYVFPAEMVNITMKPKFLENFHGDALARRCRAAVRSDEMSGGRIIHYLCIGCPLRLPP